VEKKEISFSEREKAPLNLLDPKETQPEEGRGYTRFLSFLGEGGTLFGIYITNILLTILTVGFYSFWGKVRVRRYLMSHTEFDDDRFAYHGTGKEMLIGFLKAILFLVFPIVLLNVLPELVGTKGSIKIAAQVLTSGIVMVFIPVAMVGARRYRLSRTSWRGIRFSFRGNASDFIKIFFIGSFLTVISLGLYYPFFDTQRHKFMVSQTYFGNQKFYFDGNGREMLGPFLLALVLTIPTLGLCWFWFLARRQRFLWGHTSFSTVRFRSTVTGGDLLKLHLTNLLLLIVTLGVSWPWVKVRKIRFIFRYLSLEGPLDLEEIKQEAREASATGEALAGIMDASFDLG